MKTGKIITMAGAVSLLIAAAPPRDWAQSAVDDLHFVRAILRENHPGPVDPENSAFAQWYRTGFDAALAKAEQAQDFAGYYFAIKYYTNGFQDGHLGALSEDNLEEGRLARRWPGFLIGYRNGVFSIRYTLAGEPGLPVAGDELLSCDGRSAAMMAQDVIGGYLGLWSIAGMRPGLAPYLLLDQGNPFVARPTECRVRSKHKTRNIRLNWRSIDATSLRKLIEGGDASHISGVRRFGKNSYWITIPSFSTVSEERRAANQSLLDAVKREASALRAADRIVFDVRGNGGGNSEVGATLLGEIWGRNYIDYATPQSTAVDWRASSENLRFIRSTSLEVAKSQFGVSSPQAKAADNLAAGIERALANGDVFYRETIPSPSAARPEVVRARPILLTDSACASACLDFADMLILGLKGLHIGKETRADAIYIDNRAVRLPSGLGLLGFSMKVYRGRPRGHNITYKPAHEWQGDIVDTAALQKWVEKSF